ncbi:hypothetical protein ACJZ2D_007904 [Fusarium nematophilum]
MDSTPDTSPPYTIQDVDGKGKGLVATRLIPKGTRILSEPALVVGPSPWVPGANQPRRRAVIASKVNRLPPDQKSTFFALHDPKQLQGVIIACRIFDTNAFHLNPPAEDVAAVFAVASWANHSCGSNSFHSWNEVAERLTIHAVSDIKPGEEITVSYVQSLKVRAARQRHLGKSYRFVCKCQKCGLAGDQLKQSEKRLHLAMLFDLLVSGRGREGSVGPLRTLHALRARRDLLVEEGLAHAALEAIYQRASDLSFAEGETARAKVFTERALELNMQLLGDDNPGIEELRYEIRELTLGEQQPVASSAAPNAHESEEWLWKAAKACATGLADLANQSTFPAPDDLPSHQGWSPDYFTLSEDGTHFRPRKAWCLLAEFVRFEYVGCISVKDRQGRVFSVCVSRPCPGWELLGRSPQVQSTIAVLYAERRQRLEGPASEYISAEYPGLAKVFPISLDSLMTLSARVQQYSVQRDGMRKCHACERESAALKACTRCGFFYYCNTDCQTKGWRDKSHKKDCKLLSDPDMKGMFRTAWDDVRGELHFPLDEDTRAV